MRVLYTKEVQKYIAKDITTRIRIAKNIKVFSNDLQKLDVGFDPNRVKKIKVSKQCMWFILNNKTEYEVGKEKTWSQRHTNDVTYQITFIKRNKIKTKKTMTVTPS